MKKASPAEQQRPLLLRMLDEAYDHTAWHGPTLKGAVRRVRAKQAVWRPAGGRHSIADVAVHCAYWKYAVRRRIRSDKRGSFPLKGSNWLTLPDRLTETDWRGFLKLLDDEHAALRVAVETAPWSRLTAGPGGGSMKPAAHIHGVAMHDLYHAGQIQTIKALYKNR